MKLHKFLPVVLFFLITTHTVLSMNFSQNGEQEEQAELLAQPSDEFGWNRWANFWQSVKTYVHEKKVFISEFWRNRHQVGSIFPSSKYLAKSMTKPIKYCDSQTPITILDAGAGTGPFTKRIIKRVLAQNFDNWTLDVVEIDPVLYDVLKKNITKEFGQISNVNFLCCDITTLDPTKQYDLIISGLPFHSFPPALVHQILELYSKLIKPGGTVIFFEYIAIQTLKKPFLSDDEQDTLESIRDEIRDFRGLGKLADESIVWRNLLPARVIEVVF